MPDIFTLETQDFRMVKGDTKYIAFQFVDEDGVNVDMTLTSEVKFNVMDPLTDEIVAALAKLKGSGVYDANAVPPAGIIIADYQLVIEILDADTTAIETGVYPYDLEIQLNNKRSTIRGNLIISKEITTNA